MVYSRGWEHVASHQSGVSVVSARPDPPEPDITTLHLDIDIEYLPPPPPAAHLRVRGELDLATADDLRDALTREFTAGYTDVLLDLVGVTFMDSSGLRLLEWARRETHAVGGRLVLGPISNPVRRFLSVAGADPLLA